MRAIDENALLALVKKNAPFAYHILAPIAAITPTIEAEFMRHGKWDGWHGEYMRKDGKMQYFRYYECSECCVRTAVKSNYCPRCGAKMDGGTQDVDT